MRPPAVEPEEPPMSISTQDMALLVSLRPPWPMESKPAVRRVTDWNRALSPFCQRGMSPRVAGLSNSSIRKNRAPPTISTAVMRSTILL